MFHKLNLTFLQAFVLYWIIIRIRWRRMLRGFSSSLSPTEALAQITEKFSSLEISEYSGLSMVLIVA